MAKMDLKHEVVSAIKAVAKDLGHTPSKREFVDHKLGLGFNKVENAFGLWGYALDAAGLEKNKPEKKKEKKFKFIKHQLESFHVHEMDKEEVFKNKDFVELILMPDTHCKHRDVKAVDCFLKCIEKINVDIFIILGDFIDAVGISHWPPDDLEPRRLVPEVIEARELLASITRKLGDSTRKIYLEGNHENWIQQAMVAKLPELFDGLDELGLTPDLQKLLDLEKFGFDLVPMNHFLKIMGLYFTHGLYVGNGHPKKHMDVVKGNIFYGHMHDDFQGTQPGIMGTVEAASCGCLCKLDAPFMKGKPTNWSHGFRRIRLYKDGSYLSEQIRIKDGKALFMGSIVDGSLI
jgi:predicted phosphodiesterase